MFLIFLSCLLIFDILELFTIHDILELQNILDILELLNILNIADLLNILSIQEMENVSQSFTLDPSFLVLAESISVGFCNFLPFS